ncbi:hypothetical protein JCM8547_005591 [Rhodosporidiobolus lusitaniae]
MRLNLSIFGSLATSALFFNPFSAALPDSTNQQLTLAAHAAPTLRISGSGLDLRVYAGGDRFICPSVHFAIEGAVFPVRVDVVEAYNPREPPAVEDVKVLVTLVEGWEKESDTVYSTATHLWWFFGTVVGIFCGVLLLGTLLGLELGIGETRSRAERRAGLVTLRNKLEGQEQHTLAHDVEEGQ